MSQHGEILKRLIKEGGYRQEDFAEKMNVSRSYLINLLGKSKINEKYIEKACGILNVDTNVFTLVNKINVEPGEIDYMLIIRSQQDIIEHLKEKINELENPIQIPHEKRKDVKKVKAK